MNSFPSRLTSLLWAGGFLLAYLVPPSYSNDNLSTSLAYEIKRGSLENVKMLIDQGANPNSFINCFGKNNWPISSLAVIGQGDEFDSDRFSVAYYLFPMLNSRETSGLLDFLLLYPETNDYVRKLYYESYLDKLSDKQKADYYFNSALFANVVIPEFKEYALKDPKTSEELNKLQENFLISNHSAVNLMHQLLIKLASCPN